MINYTHTLCWNLCSEVEKSVKLLYEQNDTLDFIHFIVDLEFPIDSDENIDIDGAKKRNTKKLKEIASKYNSIYIKLENEGVSQNWTNVYKYIKENYGFSDSDCLICIDPDERPTHNNWIKAVGEVLREGYAWASITMPEHHNCLNPTNTIRMEKNGIRYWEIIGSLNWAQGGFSGKFLNECGGVAHMEDMEIYGGIEEASIYIMGQLGYKWCVLPDYGVIHTDYENGHEGASRLLREWKNHIVFGGEKQITFEEWLKRF